MTVLTGHLTIEAVTITDLAAAIARGPLDVQITAVTLAGAGELLTHQLRPLLIEALTPLAAGVPRFEGTGPLVRVHIATDAS